jgi:hypothetical protein
MESIMEAKPMELRRETRSFRSLLHAVSGAARSITIRLVPGHSMNRSFGDRTRKEFMDIYGRSGKPDMFSDRNFFDFFTGRSRGGF